ncbi:histone deacetylase [Reticulomyxa filosa]|uniref:Histone deacetylase n=1 Tax=Reticulomyxa filosa TaxID=46433 RepID=X6NNM1_RETFI|nr:histone deacetylase [Reticulomyxa filosa]|eukprot:ETO27601.1 histone deacetylase [Reticulomyxa filosa]
MKGSESKKRNVGLAYHEKCLLHIGPKSHPESPARVEKIIEELKKQGLLEQCVQVTGKDIPLATEEQLLLTHEESHITKVLNGHKDLSASMDDYSYMDSDTYFCKDSAEAEKDFVIKPPLLWSFVVRERKTNKQKHMEKALLAVGSIIDLMEKVIRKELDSGFAVVRPPGHHCEKHRTMGFCLFSNVVVAINTIRHKYKSSNKYQRFAIIDWFVKKKKKIKCKTVNQSKINNIITLMIIITITKKGMFITAMEPKTCFGTTETYCTYQFIAATMVRFIHKVDL